MPGFTNYAVLLSKEALLLLFAFDQWGELLMPHEALKAYVSHAEVNKALKEIEGRGLLRPQTRPYKLNKTGMKVIKTLRQRYEVSLNKNEACILLRSDLSH